MRDEQRKSPLGAKRGAGETRTLVLEKHRQGLVPRDIARLLDISTQAVYQHLDRLRADGELEREAAS